MRGRRTLREVSFGRHIEDTSGQIVDDARDSRRVAEGQHRAAVVDRPRVFERTV